MKGALPRGGVPGGTTWGTLFGDATMGALVSAMNKARSDERMRMATWNPRWMVSPNTEQVAAKRKRIQRAIGAGAVVAIQETHWAVGDMAIWGGGAFRRG